MYLRQHEGLEDLKGGGDAPPEERASERAEMSPEELKDIIRYALRRYRSYLMEHESKEILEGIGIATSGFLVAGSEDEAVEISNGIGYPVVLKIVSPDVVHKTDAGGVKLNLMNADGVRQAYREIVHLFRYRHIDGVAVQKMAAPGLEAIVGVTQDPSFGPVLMFGLGGVFVEVLKDVSFRVLPVTEKDVAAMIEQIKGYPLLSGYRGQAVDIPALTRVLMAVSQLVTEYPQIRELDINPLILYPWGCVAADARMFLGEAPQNQSVPAAARDNLRDFFYPRSIAVLGATDKPGKLGCNVLANLLTHDFQGRLYPVNPRRESLLGLRAYRSVLDVDDAVDLAIVIVPVEAVTQAVEECCRKGIRYIVIETAGFAETGEEGEKIQARIREIMVQTGCRILGPNCSGVINTHHNMVQSIGMLEDLGKGNIGLIAQAGVYAAGILTGLRNVVDFGIVATIGNKMDISETDVLEYLGEDENIDVIAMYMEDVKSGRRFVDVAGRVTAKKPVIVLKAGRTEAGQKAVSSHTASLAGNDAVNSAAFTQSGIIRARDNEHLFGLMRAFSRQPIPRGDGVMVITYTGSLGVAATDMLSLSGLKLSTLSPYLEDRLRHILPGYMNIQNPVDCSFSMEPGQVRKLIEIGLQSYDVNSFIIILQGENLGAFADSLKDMDWKGKPVLCCVACKEFMMEDVIKMEQAGIPVYSTAEMAAEVLGEMYHYGVRRQSVIADSIARRLPREMLVVDNVPVRFRLISQKDIELWMNFVNSCSPRSLWLRFLSPFSATPERADRFCRVDPGDEVAVVAEMTEADHRKLIGVARLIKNAQNEEAEYSVIVSDQWQRKSLGYVMSERCIELARNWGVKAVRAETIQENISMIKILRHCKFQLDFKDENMLSMSLNL